MPMGSVGVREWCLMFVLWTLLDFEWSLVCVVCVCVCSCVRVLFCFLLLLLCMEIVVFGMAHDFV